MNPKMFLDEANKTFTFDNSAQSISCDRKLYYKCSMGLQKKRPNIAPYFGQAFHKFVETFWMGADPGDCIKSFTDYARKAGSPLIDDPESEENRTVQRGLIVCTYYIKHYLPERSRTKVVTLGDSQVAEVPFCFPLGADAEGWTYLYAGRIDRVELRDERTRIVDTKTTTRMGKDYWNILRPNDQITGYAAAYKEFTGKIPDFCVIDAIYIGEPRKADEKGNYKIPATVKKDGQDAIDLWMANVKFEQGPTMRSTHDIEDWWDNTMRAAVRMRKLFKHEHDFRSWEKRTSQCGNYGACDFRELCSLCGPPSQPVMDSLYEIKHWSPFGDENGEAAG